MTHRPGHTSVAVWLFIVTALSATVLVAALLWRLVPPALVPASAARREAVTPPVPGVLASITAADVSIRRRLPALSLSLGSGQVLDPRLPEGRFDADFVVSFDPGPVRRAQIGAEIQGGSLTIERRGARIVEFSATGRARTAMSVMLCLPGREVSFTYRFTQLGEGPVRLRALWRPQGASIDLPLPSGGGGLLSGPRETGYALVRQLNCVACHRSESPARQEHLAVSPAPVLGQVGARVRPGWVRRWLADPHEVKDRVAMPALFHGVDDAGEQIEDLTHFLVSMGGPIEAPRQEPERALSETGRLLYHRIGCVACHGPLDGSRPAPDRTPLGPLAAKTTVDALAAFLEDPVHLRPSGRMPSSRLTATEAGAIAAFLIQHDRAASGSVEPVAFSLDAARVRRGRAAFAARGCANCHDLGPDRQPIATTLRAPSLERLATVPPGDPLRGCLGAEAIAGTPDFRLALGDRRAIAAFLHDLGSWRSDDVPLLELAVDLDRLNCLACHEFHGVGGPATTLDRYFTTLADLDAGDEGRLPPALTGVGSRLRPQWLNTVLQDAGVVRPYMATRMPQYGSAIVGHLAPLFAAAAGEPVASPPHDDGPVVDLAAAQVGRLLVGDTGFNCIQCHSIAGRASTGVPGPDLITMPQRLRYGYFSRWLHDPKQIRPGTRMPSFFYAGKSGLPQFGGDAEKQIAAMWGYLSQGEFLALPEGLANPGDYQIEVHDEPIVFRTFMSRSGDRAIACGFPQQIHYTFDAGRCRLSEVWVGRFLNVAGAWAARGGSATDPEQDVVWAAGESPVVVFTGPPADARFRGYQLDSERRPSFLYDLAAGDEVVHVREQPVPLWTDGRPSLQRHFELTGPPGRPFVVLAAGHRFVDSGESADSAVHRGLDKNGAARFTLELSW